MKQRESYVLKNIEECIILLHSTRSDYDILKKARLSTNMLYEIRRQFGLDSYREALSKYIEITINDSILPSERTALCEFLMDYGFESIIKWVPDEELKLKYLKRMNNQHAKAQVLASLSDKDIKIEYCKGLDDEKDRLLVYSSLKSDEEKLACIDRLTDYHKKAELVASFDDDDLKAKYIFSGEIHSSSIAVIVASMKDDKRKESLLNLIPSDTARLRVILTFKDNEAKKRLYESSLASEFFREKNYPKLIRSLPLEEQLQHFSEYSDGIKYMILKDCDFETQMKLMPEIADSSKKRLLLDMMPAEFILKYMADHYADTSNFWVRTDSEEREPNTPRDDRELVASEIVKYSSISDDRKVAVIRTYIKDKEKIRSLLREMPYEFVMSKYFMLDKCVIDINMIDKINDVYDIESMEDVVITAGRDFDFDDPANQDLIARVKKMKYPKFSVNDMDYQYYKKWVEMFDDSDVIMIAENVDISGEKLSLDDIQELVGITRYVSLGGRFMTDVNKYFKAMELSREIFPLGEDEKYDSVRDEIEICLTSSGQIGATLVTAEKVFYEAGFSDEEVQRYGERLFAGLYNFDHDKYPNLRFALDVDSVELFYRWDVTKKILFNDLTELASEMTRDSIKRAVEMASEQGAINDEFAVEHILDFLTEKNISSEGLEYAKKIVLELMQKQSLKIKDIKKINPGSYSDVFEIGDFVLKLGAERATKPLPEHPRILSSCLRFEVKKEDDVLGTFVEVQPKLITIKATFNSENEERKSILHSVFGELRSQHILWGDAAMRNLGYAPIYIPPIQGLFSDLKDTLEADENVTIYHSRGENNIPQVSEDINNPYLMVIDTDFLYLLDEDKRPSDIRLPSYYSMEFEEVYRNNGHEVSPKIYKKREKNLTEQIDELYEEFGW